MHLAEYKLFPIYIRSWDFFLPSSMHKNVNFSPKSFSKIHLEATNFFQKAQPSPEFERLEIAFWYILPFMCCKKNRGKATHTEMRWHNFPFSHHLWQKHLLSVTYFPFSLPFSYSIWAWNSIEAIYNPTKQIFHMTVTLVCAIGAVNWRYPGQYGAVCFLLQIQCIFH